MLKPKGYWRSYGGWRALLTSPYFVFAVIVSFLFFPIWVDEKWVEYSQSIFPDLLGFTLGGFAIFVAFGNEKFVSLISGSRDGDVSPLIEISASFVHFLICQIAALLYSVLYESVPSFVSERLYSCLFGCGIVADGYLPFSFFGAFLTIYALLLCGAAVIAIFKLVSLFDLFVSSGSDDE